MTISRDANGKPISAALRSLDLGQTYSQTKIDRLDIQRAQSAVLVEQNGLQYAIVSDDNYNFNDPLWRAQFEVPTFENLIPGAPPRPSAAPPPPNE